ncbi:MAG TPA: PAS domain-containing protein [Candidatus Limnocylindrales bacterium]|nr:PAS domain-containing protein [Candidatus Limnocylindrales bacterium]
MILRVFRGRLDAADEERFLQFVRDEAVTRALAVPGLLSFQPGIRPIDGDREVVLISTWNDFTSIASLDEGLDSPLSLPGGSAFIHHGVAVHYEFVNGSLRSIPLDGARIRIVRGRLRPNSEAQLFEWARSRQEQLANDGLLVAAHLGRRMVDADTEVLFAGIWREAAALDTISHEAEPVMTLDDSALSLFVDRPAVEEYGAIMLAPGAARAPALVLVDDARHCLYATPAAARLTGRSVAALTSMRVDDVLSPEHGAALATAWPEFVTSGRGEGSFAIVGPDGAVHSVHFSVWANSPWPRSHALLLSEAADRPAPDLDRALAEAGVVARHSAVPARLLAR